jgi:hypothetical protein
MIIYQYIVHANKDNFADGRLFKFNSPREARHFAEKYNQCVTEVTLAFEDSELIEDFTEEEP